MAIRVGYTGRGGRGRNNVRYVSHLVFDLRALADEGGDIAKDMIVERVEAGQGADGGMLDTDLRETGRLLSSVRVRSVRIRKDKATVDVGPDNRRRPDSKLNNVALGSVIQRGVKGRTKPRPWIGLTDEQRAKLLRRLVSQSWMRQRPGPPR